MLSKKMTVSLMSLITILALASMPAVAFDVKFDAHDISYAGDVQIERPTAAGNIEVYVNFGKVVTLEDAIAAFPTTAINTTGNKQGRVDILNSHGGVIDVIGNTVAVTRREVDNRLTADPNRIQAGKDYTITIALVDDQVVTSGETFDRNETAHRVRLFLPKDALTEADRNAGTKNNKGFHDKIFLVGDEPATATDRDPEPVSMALAPGLLIPDAGFTGDTFDIVVTLSEQPKENKLTAADHFAVDKGAAADGVYLGPAGIPVEDTDTDGYVSTIVASGRSGMHHQYLVTITPKAENGNLVFKLKSFGDQEIYTYDADGTDIDSRGPNEWKPPVSELDRMEGVHKLTVKIKKATTGPAKTAGLKFGLPKDKHIPAGGYLVVADDKDGSSIHWSEADISDAPKPHQRTPAELKYNTIALSIPNLETHLANGGTIGIMGPHSLMVTEIMWGSDASLDDPGKSQWIELYNAGAGYKTQDGDNTTYLVFYGAGETPATDLHDVVGTVDETAGYWSIAGKGQSGRTAEKVAGTAVAQVPTIPIISMNRVMDATGALASGTLASSWVQSTSPSSNFESNRLGVHIGSPGAMPVTFPEPPAPTPAPAPAAAVAMPDDIMITEIMVDTGDGRLPQWIELTNVSGAEVSLAGWSLMITNSEADADAIGETVSINLSGTLGVGGGEDAGGTMGKSLLLVGGSARSSGNLAGSDRVVDISGQVDQRGRYTFISTMAFMAALIPPQTTGVVAYGDTAGNLDADEAWDIPMSDGGRSSLIRREMLKDGTMTMGTDANGWRLASETSLVSGPATWYGSDEDAGTPGYDAGGPLPVELSHFRPARDATGAVVITWSTQSELNNAGFFIKRSQQRDGQFKVINATMVAGAGTTSEKQFYTYTDTTAQPNIVYYYQIEDVSLDGQRQTLTNGTRLKGHIGAAGKLTSTWGELKSSNE